MKRALTCWIASLIVASAGSVTADGAELTIDYSLDQSDFFTPGSPQRQSLEAAADVFSHLLRDDLDPIAPSGDNTWQATFNHPATGFHTRRADLSIGADEVRIFAGGRGFSGSTLGKGGVGGVNVTGSDAWRDRVEARGEAGELATPASDFGPWGGAIAFDTSSRDWHFDLTSEPSNGEDDFFTVALHELGHVLGFGQADSWDAQAGADTFLGEAATATHGGEVPLADADHWSPDLTSPLAIGESQQSPLMASTLRTGTRKRLTALDLAGLEDIGWQVEGEPFPFVLGDMNGDGDVNNLDINPFVKALTDPLAFEDQFGFDPATVGDINGDVAINNLDINPFIDLLTSSSSVRAVPEPASAALLLSGLGLLLGRCRPAPLNR